MKQFLIPVLLIAIYCCGKPERKTFYNTNGVLTEKQPKPYTVMQMTIKKAFHDEALRYYDSSNYYSEKAELLNNSCAEETNSAQKWECIVEAQKNASKAEIYIKVALELQEK